MDQPTANGRSASVEGAGRDSASRQGAGPIAALTGLTRNIFGLLVSRVELAALELTEVRKHAIELMAVFALAVICVGFALAYGSAMVVALAWDSMGWKILRWLFLVFLAAALVLVLKLRRMLRENKLAFPETMNELKNDRDMLL